MNNSQGSPLQTLNKIFANVETVSTHKNFANPKHKKVNKKELELALTVLLVDLASCDQNFQPEEYHIIANGLRRLFGTTKEQVQALVNQATQVLKNLRGTSQFANLLKEHLSEAERIAVMETVEDVINADGVIEGFEVYQRHKLADLLGLPRPAVTEDDAK